MPLSFIPLRVHALSRHRTQTQTPRCQVPSLPPNVEDLPLERIPTSPTTLPAYWARPGVYGVYNAAHQLQFVAATYDVRAAIAAHIRTFSDPTTVYATRMITVEHPAAAPLDSLSETWVLAHVEFGPGVPPGNGDAEPRWRDDPAARDVGLDSRTGEVDAAIRAVLREHRVVLFMKGTFEAPRCNFSSRTIETLAAAFGDAFVCVDCLDALRNPGLREGIKAYSQWPTIPQVYVDGEFLGGTDIVADLASKNLLSSKLK